MPHPSLINGFSKLTKAQQRRLIYDSIGSDLNNEQLSQFDVASEQLQQTMDNFSENTVANFPLPFGVAPNVLVNGRNYLVPMVIEESSVVAAASSAAKFWFSRGGFQAEVVAAEKLGQLHFRWNGKPERRAALLPRLEARLRQSTAHLTERMEARGGGVLGLTWKHLPAVAPDYYQLLVSFNTQDSMGANFINTILEEYGNQLTKWIACSTDLSDDEREVEIIMAILSNYTPNCIVRAWVMADIEAMQVAGSGIDAHEFSRKFELAVKIATEDPYRAVTHNKGIMNGVDAVVLATGNDFRAVEASVNAYAARDGQYRSLSRCEISTGQFLFELSLPLALGTVGGLTKLHPLANFSLDLLGRPKATELMEIVAATGLAQNFAALRSLVTTGIQKGHMKMHLQNILQSLDANECQRREAVSHFAERTVSHHAVKAFLNASKE
ncbi:hydroxymethylglutaryl-CoA reductase [Lewinellaceae bacterium SD302]|nr:hydroxymethylglutaryl-CoA reductase [Lewinellaceae bacterium SD302]